MLASFRAFLLGTALGYKRLDCDFYLCGPEDFVKTLHDELRAAGVAAAQIFSQSL